jgi:hypothetical protein
VSASAALCKTHQRKCTSMRTSDGFPSYSFHRTRAKNHAEQGICWYLARRRPKTQGIVYNL